MPSDDPIERLRAQLIQLYAQTRDLHDPRLLALSQALDGWILRAQRDMDAKSPPAEQAHRYTA
ncbi:MAG: Spo0E family sporulation regulatory protein-aspartic acid phosphatase [Firmicutes bacterium]|nr:aspartyl-phosphate phosphatase Spo0E family protein [Alicyclobacillaceae bacterium]MCL6497301.1 Spo0E family sporulation regulatory protein-aspartic acid phosphatase [Bacillota bacterium]